VYRIQGLLLLLRTQSRIDRRIIESGSWEPEQISRLTALTKRAQDAEKSYSAFLDIGAYFGFYALVMLRERVFDQIVAFEPDAANFAQLGAQLYLNSASYEIDARRIAVSDGSGERLMPRSDIRKNRGTSGLDITASPADLQRVTTTSIDESFDLRGALVVAKIDVEGHQGPVLHGMRNTIAHNRVILQMEVWDNERGPAYATLEALGMRVIEDKVLYPDMFATNIEGLGFGDR
jgi:FkbM family methyltransferase